MKPNFILSQKVENFENAGSKWEIVKKITNYGRYTVLINHFPLSIRYLKLFKISQKSVKFSTFFTNLRTFRNTGGIRYFGGK